MGWTDVRYQDRSPGKKEIISPYKLDRTVKTRLQRPRVSTRLAHRVKPRK